MSESGPTPFEPAALDPELAALLAAERAAPPMPAAMQQQVMNRLQDTLGVAMTSSKREPAPDQAAHPPPSSSPLWRARLTGLLGLLVGAIAGFAAHHALAPRPQVATSGSYPLVLLSLPQSSLAQPAGTTATIAPAEAASGGASTTGSLAVGPATAPRASGSAASAVTVLPSVAAAAQPNASGEASKDIQLAAERAPLEVARTALSRGQPDAAIQSLRSHAARYPRGRLAEERESLLIQALVAAGRNHEAEQRANRFRQTSPDSILLPAVDRVLGTAKK